MDSTDSIPPAAPDTLHGNVSPVSTAGGALPSPIGSLNQYKPAERFCANETSITGATVDDPTGSKSRVQVVRDPDWASPLRGFSLAAEGYVFSVFTYWFGYGVLLAVVSSVLSLIFRDTVGLDTHAIAAAVVFGPLYGGLLDFELAFSASWGAPFGIAMLVVEPFLFFLFFFSSEWRERFKYLALMAVFVIVKTVIYTLVIKGI